MEILVDTGVRLSVHERRTRVATKVFGDVGVATEWIGALPDQDPAITRRAVALGAAIRELR